MNHENQADQSALLQAACTKSKCIELLALAADYREALPQVLELLRQLSLSLCSHRRSQPVMLLPWCMPLTMQFSTS